MRSSNFRFVKLSFNEFSISWKLPLTIVGAGSLVGICIDFAAYWSGANTLGSEARANSDQVRSEYTLYPFVSEHFLVDQVFPPDRKTLFCNGH